MSRAFPAFSDYTLHTVISEKGVRVGNLGIRVFVSWQSCSGIR